MIQVVYSTQHWIVPKIVIGILAILLTAIIVSEGYSRVKAGVSGCYSRHYFRCSSWYDGDYGRSSFSANDLCV